MPNFNAGARRRIGPRTRRVFVRLGASVTVMAGLGAVSHEEPPSAPLPQRTAVEAPAVPERRAAEAPAANPPVPAPAVRLAAWTAPAAGKTARLRMASAAPAASTRKAVPDVPYFDECEPACESRDPLLAGSGGDAQALSVADEETLLDIGLADDDPEVVPVADLAASPADRPGLLGRVTHGVASAANSGTRTVMAGLGRLAPW